MARNGHQTVVIRLPDTDVAVLGMRFSFDIEAQLFRTGTKNRARIVNLTDLANLYTPQLCRALPGLHTLTG